MCIVNKGIASLIQKVLNNKNNKNNNNWAILKTALTTWLVVKNHATLLEANPGSNFLVWNVVTSEMRGMTSFLASAPLFHKVLLTQKW